MENSGSSEDLHVIKSLDYLKSVLVTGETLDAWAIQRRLFALTHIKACIIADYNYHPVNAFYAGAVYLSFIN